MERLFNNPEWNELIDQSQMYEPGIVEDQVNKVIGRIKRRSYKLQNPTLSLSELELARSELDLQLADLSVLFQQPGVLEIYENFLQYEAYVSRGNPLENFHLFRKQFGI